MACGCIILRVALAALCLQFVAKLAYGQIESKVANNLISLYVSLRQVVLPDAKGSFGDYSSEMQRFIMQHPGEVIYPSHYATNLEKKEFHLSDILPSVNPLAGKMTETSLTSQYRKALDSVRVRGIEELTAMDRKKYVSAVDALAKLQIHPVYGKNITLQGLYSFYKNEYYQSLLELQGLDIEKCNEGGGELRVSPCTLAKSKATSIYNEWITLGRKREVESYLTQIRLLPSDEELVNARQVLDARRVSLPYDGSSIYPAEYTPSDWLNYIQHNSSTESKDQISAQIGVLKARRTILQAIIDAPSDYQQYITGLSTAYNDSTAELIRTVANLKELWLKCQEELDSPSCRDLEHEEIEVFKWLNINSQSYLIKDSATNIFKDGSGINASIKALISALDANISYLVTQQETAAVSLPSIPYEISRTDCGLSIDEHEDGWKEFQFDSTVLGQLVDTRSKTYSVAFRYGVLGGLWSVSGGAQFSKQDSQLMHIFSAANVKITSKILPVQIKRKWFMPSIFRSPQIVMERSNSAVSPGHIPEEEIVAAYESHNLSYILPAFPSAVIIAKDIIMEFTGMTLANKVAALKMCSDPMVHASYGPFTVFGSLDADSCTQVFSLASGLRLVLPGSQIIGHVMNTLPKFPYE